MGKNLGLASIFTRVWENGRIAAVRSKGWLPKKRKKYIGGKGAIVVVEAGY